MSIKEKCVVILVDDRLRDLPMAALIALHLEHKGIKVYLEPLESFKAALAAYKPDLIMFNHMLASHIVDYSLRLKELGVLTAVLPNEGIMYEKGERDFNAGRSHSGAHIDVFFCWHRYFKEALLEAGFTEPTKIEVVGPPRFDFYFKPWSKIWELPEAPRKRPKILVATNFGLAHFVELPRFESEKFFSAWVDRIPTYKDYWTAIEIHYRSREKVLEYLEQLAASGKFEVILRPHPREEVGYYQEWLKRMPASVTANLEIDKKTNISALIMDADIEISMDRCTTALEAWISGKPTVEIEFERHPILSDEERTSLNVQCNNPDEIVAIVERELANPEQAQFAEGRSKHLENWMNAPSGNSTMHIADSIEQMINERGFEQFPSHKLSFSDKRKGLKLKWLKLWDLPYNWRMIMPLRRLLQPVKSEMSYRKIQKAITRSDVAKMMDKLKGYELNNGNNQ